jgi:hypothetical protein
MKENGKNQHPVRVHINRKPYETVTPTTPAALYDLGQIPNHYDLFREVGGNLEDDPVPRGSDVLNLKPDEHFYSEREYTIIVNARPKKLNEPALSFEQLVQLAFDQPPTGGSTLFTITFRNGPKPNREGALLGGQNVKIKNGMIFNVTATDKS